MSDYVDDQIMALHAKIAHLAGIVERTHRQGKVTDVDYSDATKPRVRIAIGKDADGEDVKGPWVPVASHAGDRKIHAPVTKGQTLLMIAPDGNFESALALNYGFSEGNKSPSTKEDEHVDEYGDVTTTLKKVSHSRAVKKIKITHTADGFTLDADGTKFAFSKSGLDVKGGKITHDDLNIGSSHKHGQVMPGSGETGVPEA